LNTLYLHIKKNQQLLHLPLTLVNLWLYVQHTIEENLQRIRYKKLYLKKKLC